MAWIGRSIASNDVDAVGVFISSVGNVLGRATEIVQSHIDLFHGFLVQGIGLLDCLVHVPSCSGLVVSKTHLFHAKLTLGGTKKLSWELLRRSICGENPLGSTFGDQIFSDIFRSHIVAASQLARGF